MTALAIGMVGLGALGGCSSWDDNKSSTQYSQNTPAAPAMKTELTQGMVQKIQTKLQAQNTYTGSIDGIWGPQTQAAVRSYQQAHGLTASGQMDSATMTSMNMSTDDPSNRANTPQQAAAPMQPIQPTQAEPPSK